jgi:hypothetical protein
MVSPSTGARVSNLPAYPTNILALNRHLISFTYV